MRLVDASIAEPLERVLFRLPKELEAREPAEERGTGRDDVRLLVTHERGMQHAQFRQLPDFLAPGDLVVVNSSATIPAALAAHQDNGSAMSLHVSTRLPADLYVVEPRPNIDRSQRLQLEGGAEALLLTPYLTSQRLWIARLALPSAFLAYMMRYGHPIRYRHASREYPLDTYQNVYADEPGSAEMPSAGRPITRALLDRFRFMGIRSTSIVLHAGVSSAERHEPPFEEWFEVTAHAAAAVRRARRRGSRVVAVGTTVVRALESSLDAGGDVVASRGWTDLVITPKQGVRSVDALLTGFHEPKSSHLAMLEAIAGRDRIVQSYQVALSSGYLWHEFGDSHLILPRR